MQRLKYTEVRHIELDTNKGITLASAISEGISLAATENITVIVIYNNKEYTIRPRSIIDNVIEHPI